ncbi:hypothetical protein Tco_0446682 [Tanacetum coccineum]
MSRAKPQETIVSEEQLVPSANRLVIKKNNQCVTLDSNITYTMLRFVVGILRHHKLYKPVSLTTTVPIISYTKNQILRFIKTLRYDEDPKANMTSVSTFVATRLRQPWRAILSVINRSLTGKDISWDTTRLLILEIYWGIFHSANLDFASLIWDEFEWQAVDRTTKQSKMSKLIAKKAESEKGKADEELEEQHVSPIRHRIRKADNIVEEPVAVELAKSISIEDQRRQQRDIMSQLIIDRQIDKDIEDMYAEWGQKQKGLEVKDPAVQSLLDLHKGSKASRLETTNSDAIRDSSCLDTDEEKEDETDDTNDSDMVLSKDEPKGDDDATGYGVFMYNKSTEPLKSTYLSLTVTSSSLDYIQNLLNETPTHELIEMN